MKNYILFILYTHILIFTTASAADLQAQLNQKLENAIIGNELLEIQRLLDAKADPQSIDEFNQCGILSHAAKNILIEYAQKSVKSKK